MKDEVEAVPVANGDDVFELIGIFVISTRSMAGDDRSLDERCPAFFRSVIKKKMRFFIEMHLFKNHNVFHIFSK